MGDDEIVWNFCGNGCFQYMHVPSTSKRVASKAARHATTSASKHFGHKPANPRFLLASSRTRTYPGVIIVADRRGASQEPTSAHSTLAVCQAYSVLLKRREHLILLLPYTIQLQAVLSALP